MRNYITYITAAVLLASCSDLESLSGGGEVAELTVSGVTADAGTADVVSRAALTPDATAITSGSIGLYLEDSSGSTYDGTAMQNKMYTYYDAAWHPGTTTDKIGLSSTEGTLYAYYPYSSGAGTDKTKIPVTASNDGSDYCYGTVTALDRTDVPITIAMKHALSRIDVKLKKATKADGKDEYTKDGVMTRLSLSGAGIGTSGTINMTKTVNTTGSITASEGSFTLTNLYIVLGDSVKCLVVPVTPTTANDVTLSCTVDGTDLSVSLGKLTLAQGKRFVVTATVHNSYLELDSVKVKAWNNIEKTAVLEHYDQLNGHEYVAITNLDGSVTKWATMNVGASTIAESAATCFGMYYAHDTTTEYIKTIDWSTGTITAWNVTNGFNAHSYTASHYSGKLLPAYDPAHLLWGGQWIMPTSTDQINLDKACGRTGANADVNAQLTESQSLLGQRGAYSIAASAASPVTIDGTTYKVNGLLYVASTTDITKRLFFPFSGYISGATTTIQRFNNMGSYFHANLNGTATAFDFAPTAATVTLYEGNGGWQEGQVIRPIIDDNNIDGHTYVDLGLPSGTKWATMNIGASSYTDGGSFFAWGETTARDVTTSTAANYKWITWNRYNTTDNYTILLPEDDAAYVNWGPNWCTPTMEDCQELIANCTFEKDATLNCIKATSKINSNFIYLPIAGAAWGGKAEATSYVSLQTSTLGNVTQAAYYKYNIAFIIDSAVSPLVPQCDNTATLCTAANRETNLRPVRPVYKP